MDTGHLRRLRRIRALLTARGRDGAAGARLVLYSAAGFRDDLIRAAATDDGVVLVGPHALYRREQR
jgi:hypothetical protein